MNSRIEGMPASVVPAGRTCCDTDFSGTSSLAANFRCRFATLQDWNGGWSLPGPWRAGGGFAWAKAGGWDGFGPLKGAAARLGPPSPTFAHIDFSKRSLEPIWGNGVQEFWSIGGSGVGENQEVRSQKGADLRGKIWLPKPATRWMPQRSCS